MKNIIIILNISLFFAQDPISLTAESDNFTLDGIPPIIAILNPSGDESFLMSETITVEWDFIDDSNFNNSVNIELINNNNNEILESWNIVENVGFYQIQFPDLANIQAYFKISMEDVFGNGNFNNSEVFTIGVTTPISLTAESENFTLDGIAPSVEWLSPENNEYFESGEEITVNYSAIDDSFESNPITIQLTNNSNDILSEYNNLSNLNESQIILPELTYTDATFIISAIDEFGNSATNNAEGPIHIGYIDPINFTSTSQDFILDSKAPEIYITQPNGGEEFIVNDNIEIEWDSLEDNPITNSVNIFISTTEIEQYTSLQNEIENSGTSNVTTPGNLTSFGRIKISITDYFGNIGEDISDDYFSILPIPDIVFIHASQLFTLDSKAPEVIWINPNDGGILPSGEEIQTEWTTTDDSFNESPVTVSIQENGSEISVIENQSSTGQHPITLPDIVSSDITFRISATDQFGNSAYDESDSTFSLKKFGCTDELANNYNNEAEIDDGSCIFTTNIELSIGNNLISLPGPLPDNSTQSLLEYIEAQCESEISFILGQGVGLFKLDDDWSGNLNNLDNYSGYWINSNSHCEVEYEINGFSDECLGYELNGGNNLVSYAGEDNAETVEALGGEVFSGLFSFILGQGQGLFATENGWSGNLTTLENKKGYWLNSNIPNPAFQWGADCESVEPVAKEIVEHKLPEEYQVNQSTEQAFYLIEELTIDGDNPKSEDLILAYHNDVLVGSANYSEFTVLPIMGRDLSEQTIGFIEAGQTPELKLLKASGELVDLEAELEPFSNLLVSEVASVTGSTIVIPIDYALHPAYPNPFNPVTNISYALPIEAQISLNVYDVEGRKITTLTEGIKAAGNHTIEWNAEGYPSGVYFVKLDAGEFKQTQKLMLVK